MVDWRMVSKSEKVRFDRFWDLGGSNSSSEAVWFQLFGLYTQIKSIEQIKR
jgi:hypothetical protein